MKLIIDIPADKYELIVGDKASGLNFLTRAVAYGTPLDTVKAEIADIYCGQYCENPRTADAVREMVLDILDNIGKADMRESIGKKIRCNTCKNNDDELSGECYECVKGIFDHYEPKGSEE